MEIRFKPSGIAIVEGLTKEPPTYLQKLRRNGDIYFTSWRWLPALKQHYHLERLPIVEGREYLKKFKLQYDRVSELLSKDLCETHNSNGHPPSNIFKFNLWDLQWAAAYVMAVARRFYLADDVGLGKTLSSFAALVLLKSMGFVDRAYVLTLSSLKFQWKDEIENAVKEEFQSQFKVSVIYGTAAERKIGYEQDAFLYVANYEGFLADYKKFKISPLQFPVQAIVCDEAWKLKNRTTKLNKALRKMVEGVPFRFALNGTPITNKYEDLFGVFTILDPLVFISWKNFSTRYALYKQIKLRTGRTFPKLIGYRKVEEIQSLLYPMLLRRRIQDINWPKPQVLVLPYWVELTDNQRRRYEAIRSSDINPLTKTIKARIACLLDNPFSTSPKAIQLLEILEEVFVDQKVLIFSESLEFLENLLKLLRERKIKSTLIQGADSSLDRRMKCRLFTEGNIRALLLTSAGEAGLNLQAADIVINMDLPWSPARLQQRVGRLRPHLGGKARQIRVVNILARNTVEGRVVEAIRKKLGHVARFFEEVPDDFTGLFDPQELVRQL